MEEDVIKRVLSIYSGLETKLLDEIVKHFKINHSEKFVQKITNIMVYSKNF